MIQLDGLSCKYIYVAASSQHVGKTTCTLGIVANLLAKGYNTGYCKPVGQKFISLNDIQIKISKEKLIFI